MKDNNNKNIIILLMGVIIIILLTLCILFATNTIVLKQNIVNNENNQSNIDNNDNETSQNEVNNNNQSIIYYQWYPEEDESLGGTHSTDILELNSDGTAKLYGGKRNSDGWNYEGKYTETDNEIVFKGYAVTGYEELLGTDEYTKTFKKQTDNSIIDERNYIYLRVSKDEIKK